MYTHTCPLLTRGIPASPVQAGAVIGAPYNVEHKEHVTPDPHSSTGFKGLPVAWTTLLKASGITKEDAVANPQAVLDCLAFHMEGPPPPVPSDKKLENDIQVSTHSAERSEPAQSDRLKGACSEGPAQTTF